MMQIEIRVDGILVDYVDITQTGPHGDGWASYIVQCGIKKRTVPHHCNDGVLKLAASSLDALTKRRKSQT